MTESLRLIDTLRRQLEASDGQTVELAETHISWVLLTREFAYKLKKPVRLDFLDFSTLELRRHFCAEELRLNQRLAADLYVGVVPISGPLENPRLGDASAVIEYAVKMRRFENSQLAAELLKRHSLTPERIDCFARTLADFHQRCPQAAPASPHGELDVIARYAEGNLKQIADHARNSEMQTRSAHLRAWTTRETARLAPLFARRKAVGAVRECHGDLHLGNVVEWQGQLLGFDALEFNPELRWVDVLSEIAFLDMDFTAHDQPAYSARLLNRYLELSGDYDGLPVYRYYLAYRAAVRALVAAIRQDQSAAALAADGEFQRYLALAERYMQTPAPQLWITYGVSGSGKTYGTQAWLERHGAIRVRSDVERKRLYGLPPDSPTPAERTAELYSPEASRRTYERLAALARSTLNAGFSMIVDATFLTRSGRETFRRVAMECNVPFGILAFEAPREELIRRVKQRAQSGGDASDADVNVLMRQLAAREELSAEELALAIGCPE